MIHPSFLLIVELRVLRDAQGEVAKGQDTGGSQAEEGRDEQWERVLPGALRATRS